MKKVKKTKKNSRYFAIHVFHNRKESGSYCFKTNIKLAKNFDDDAVVNDAVARGEIDAEEVDYVTEVEEITKAEYKDMGGE